jgi:hypothetical protein
MVSKTDYLKKLFTEKAGLVEGILIPYLDPVETIRVSGLCQATRKMFLPTTINHINYAKVFAA